MTTFCPTVEKLANKVAEALISFGCVFNGINYSNTAYGCSAYIYLEKTEKHEARKIRISDHSVEGNRIFTETHIMSDADATSFIERMEKIVCPERFDIEEYQAYVKGKGLVNAKKYTRKSN